MFLCLTILATAVAYDLKDGRIPNAITSVGFILSQVYAITMTQDFRIPFISLLCAVAIIVVMYPLFAIGCMGGGDIKLLMMLPGFMGAGESVRIIGCAFVLAAILGLLKLIHSGLLIERLRFLTGYIARVSRSGRVDIYDTPVTVRGRMASHQLYFSIPIAIACAMQMLAGFII